MASAATDLHIQIDAIRPIALLHLLPLLLLGQGIAHYREQTLSLAIGGQALVLGLVLYAAIGLAEGRIWLLAPLWR